MQGEGVWAKASLIAVEVQCRPDSPWENLSMGVGPACWTWIPLAVMSMSWLMYSCDGTDIQRIVRNYYQQLYAKKFESLDEMGKFLETCNLPKLSVEAAENLKRPITASGIEAVIKKLLAHKSPGPDGFTGKFYKTFKEELTNHCPSQTIPENPRRGKCSNSFYDISIILIPKPDDAFLLRSGRKQGVHFHHFNSTLYVGFLKVHF